MIALPRSVVFAAGIVLGVLSSGGIVAVFSPARDFVRDRLVSAEATEKCVAAAEMEGAKAEAAFLRGLAASRLAAIEKLKATNAADADARAAFEAELEAARRREAELSDELGELEARPEPQLVVPRIGDLPLRLRNN